MEPLWGVLDGSWELFGSSRGRHHLTRTFIFKNERFTEAGARFSKPVRARTGSELLRERMLSRRSEKRAATDSEEMRQETFGIIIRSVIKLFLHERAGAQ